MGSINLREVFFIVLYTDVDLQTTDTCLWHSVTDLLLISNRKYLRAWLPSAILSQGYTIFSSYFNRIDRAQAITCLRRNLVKLSSSVVIERVFYQIQVDGVELDTAATLIHELVHADRAILRAWLIDVNERDFACWPSELLNVVVVANCYPEWVLLLHPCLQNICFLTHAVRY